MDSRWQIEEARVMMRTRELEDEVSRLTPVQVDNNLHESEIAYRALEAGERRPVRHPADAAWLDHLREWGPVSFPREKSIKDLPRVRTLEMSAGYRSFCERWERDQSPLGRVLYGLWEEAYRLGILDDPDAGAALRSDAVRELAAAAAKRIVAGVTGPVRGGEQSHTEPISGSPIDPNLGYSRDDVRPEAYGKAIKLLRPNDLVPVRDVNDLPEFCKLIHIMRLLKRSRSAIYTARSRIGKKELGPGERGIPLSDRDIPPPIEKGKHLMWSKSVVIRWKEQHDARSA